MDLYIRKITLNDYNEYKSLINSDISYSVYKDFITNILNDAHVIYLTIEPSSNKIVGTGTLFIECKLTYGSCKMGHIENIYVHPTYRNQRIGEKIVKHLLKYAEDQKCYRVDLNCNEELENFYLRNGFNRNQISMSVLFKNNFKL